MNVKEILIDLGYSNISEGPKEYRMRPIYRDSDNNTVLSVKKESGRFIDFSKGITGSIEDLIKLSLNLKNVEEVKTWISNKNISLERREEAKPKLVTQKVYEKDMLLKLKKDHSYWIQRGVPEDILVEFEGGVALEDLEDGQAVGDDGAGGGGPLDGVGAVVLLHVAFPEFVAGEVEGSGVAGGEVEDDGFAVGGWGGIGVVAAFVDADALAEGVFPDDLAGLRTDPHREDGVGGGIG
jgi:hypothetical protein